MSFELSAAAPILRVPASFRGRPWALCRPGMAASPQCFAIVGSRPEAEPLPLGDTLWAGAEQVTLEIHLWALMLVREAL